MNGQEALKVAVVGGGMVGVSAAEWLRRDGHDVVLIDRGPGDKAASWGNAGLIACCAITPVSLPGIVAKAPGMLLDPDQPLFLRWSYLPRLLPWLVPFLLASRRRRVLEITARLAPLVTDAVDQHLALVRGTPAQRWLKECNYLYLYRDRRRFDADGFVWQLRRDHGFEGQELDRDMLAELDPELNSDFGFGYLLGGHGTVADPGRYVEDLTAWFEGQGGRLLRAEVDALEPGDGGVRVHCGGQAIDADRVVVACGAWSRRLAGMLGHRPMLESERGYHVDFLDPSNVPRHPYMIAHAKFVATAMADGLRVAGVTEFGGLKAGPSRAPLDMLERGIRRLYPNFKYGRKREWMGHRPSTPDSLPCLGASSRHPNVYFAFGHHHVGLTAGPKSGRLIADMVAGREPAMDTRPYRVDRFD